MTTTERLLTVDGKESLVGKGWSVDPATIEEVEEWRRIKVQEAMKDFPAASLFRGSSSKESWDNLCGRSDWLLLSPDHRVIRAWLIALN